MQMSRGLAAFPCKNLCIGCKLLHVSTQLLHPVMTNAAENLDMLFRKARLSQEQVGMILGISGAQVSKLLRPERTGQVWSLKQLALLAGCFGVDVVDLLGSGSDLLARVPPVSQWKLPRPDSDWEPAGNDGYAELLHSMDLVAA
jgi:transcriptional regulator with XRE-family HTH domain